MRKTNIIGLLCALLFGYSAFAQDATIGNVDVYIEAGDMTRVRADAYIVPEFRGGASYGGVGAAVARGGGEAGLQAYDSYMSSNGELEFGRALVTPSGGGNAESLIHVVSVGSGADVEFDTVIESIKNALMEADKAGIRTIVAPALGTGIIGQLTDTQSAKAMLAGVREYVQLGGTTVEEFRVVIYG